VKFVKPPDTPKRNVLLYGPPKTGKTVGAATAPGPILYLNADLPNATWLAHQVQGDKLKELDYEGVATVKELGIAANANQLGDWETVAIDPLNELYTRILREVSGGVISPSLPKYQETQVMVERLCRALCENQQVNFVVVAHDLPVKDEGAGTVERLPASGTTNPALGRKIAGMVDIVGYTAELEVEGETKYMAQLVPAKGRLGGDRFDGLPDYAEIDLAAWFTKTGARPEKEQK
jgi:hypothetical protein